MAKNTKDLNFEEFAAEVAKKLSQDNKWIEQYQGYAETIKRKADSYSVIAEEIKKKLDSEHTGLYLYTTISGIKYGPAFDLRYQGESIATKSITGKLIKLKTTGSGKLTINEFVDKNDPENTFKNPKTKSVELDVVVNYIHRNFIRADVNKENPDGVKKGNKEHKYESMILTQMEDKTFGIDFEPIKLCGCRFQFPTKFSASSVTNGRVPDLCKGKGGIDILALHNDRLSVIELKDEGTENIKYVMRQAIVYAVFLNKLFKECPIWEEILCCQNIKGIDAVICMPEPSDGNKKAIPENGTSITYCDGDVNVKINLNYIYFNDKNDNIELLKLSY